MAEKLSDKAPGTVFVVIHMFQGVIHEVNVHSDPIKARADYEKRIIEAYDELVDEQCGNDEIQLIETQMDSLSACCEKLNV